MPLYLDLSADRLHRMYRRIRKYPNHVTGVCKFRNKNGFPAVTRKSAFDKNFFSVELK